MANKLVPSGAIRGASRDEAEGRGRIYVFEPYPAARYHPDGATRIVADRAADQALGAPWRSSPYPPPPVVIPPPELTPAQLKIAVLDLRVENASLADRLVKAEVLGCEQIVKLAAFEKEIKALRAELADFKASAPEDSPAETEADGPRKSKSARK